MHNILTDLDQLIIQNEAAYNAAWRELCNYQGTCSGKVASLHHMVEARFTALKASRTAQYKTYLAMPV
jgi:hypothetical protein